MQHHIPSLALLCTVQVTIEVHNPSVVENYTARSLQTNHDPVSEQSLRQQSTTTKKPWQLPKMLSQLCSEAPPTRHNLERRMWLEIEP